MVQIKKTFISNKTYSKELSYQCYKVNTIMFGKCILEVILTLCTGLYIYQLE